MVATLSPRSAAFCAIAFALSAAAPAGAVPLSRVAASPAAIMAANAHLSPTTLAIERAVAGRSFPVLVQPKLGPAAFARPARRAAAHTIPGLVVNVPLGGNIPAAAAQVIAAGGGTVQLAAGTYSLTASIPLGSNLTIAGQGSKTIVASPPTPHGFAMMSNATDGISNIVIQNLVLDGDIPKAAFGNSLYGGAGISLVAVNTPIGPLTISNVEIRNTGIGLLLNGVDQITIQGDYVHDNNPGYYPQGAYLVGCSQVNISHSRFDHALSGAGLQFDTGSSLTVAKSEFSGNDGIGLLDTGDTGNTVSDSLVLGNQSDGIKMSSNYADYTRLLASDSWGFGYNNGGGTGVAQYLAGFTNAGGFGQFLGYTSGEFLSATTPNVYPGILGSGPLGVIDTADWSTTYGGYSTIGEVDFNANHLTNGVLTLNVGAVGSATYPAAIRYSNGTTSTLTMPLTVNGTSLGSVSFPPTGAWTTWSTVAGYLPLNDGNNVVVLSAVAAGAPELDTLTVTAPVPAAPAAPQNVTATATGPYSVQLSWPSVAGAQFYNVYRQGRPVVLGANVTGTTFTDATFNLPNDTATYTVTAVDQGGESAPSSAVTATTPLDAPAGLQVAAVMGGYALSWIAENGATSYNVLRSTTTGGHYITIANTPTASFTDTSAAPGLTYYYVVEAHNATFTSPPSYQLSVNAPANGALSQDVGYVAIQGFTDYNPQSGGFGLAGAGTGIYGTADSFHYEYLPITGNVTMTARVTFLEALVAGSEAGIDLRSGLGANARSVFIAITGGMGAQSYVRSAIGGQTTVNGQFLNITPPYWVQVTRTARNVSTAISPDGVTYSTIGSAKLVGLPANIFVGLAVSSEVSNALTAGLFDSVTTVGTITPSLTGAERAAAQRRFNVH